MRGPAGKSFAHGGESRPRIAKDVSGGPVCKPQHQKRDFAHLFAQQSSIPFDLRMTALASEIDVP
jgi:hypothetical protein